MIIVEFPQTSDLIYKDKGPEELDSSGPSGFLKDFHFKTFKRQKGETLRIMYTVESHSQM